MNGNPGNDYTFEWQPVAGHWYLIQVRRRHTCHNTCHSALLVKAASRATAMAFFKAVLPMRPSLRPA